MLKKDLKTVLLIPFSITALSWMYCIKRHPFQLLFENLAVFLTDIDKISKIKLKDRDGN